MHWISRFLGDDDGALTIEFVLWIPIILAVLITVIDATTIYITHTEMWNVARNVARQMSTGVIGTEEEAEACATRLMGLRDLPYYVEAFHDDDTGVQVAILLRVNDFAILGYSPLAIFGRDIMARVIMRPNPELTFGTPTNPDCAKTAGSGPGKPGKKK